jgi:hypothetical protein
MILFAFSLVINCFRNTLSRSTKILPVIFDTEESNALLLVQIRYDSNLKGTTPSRYTNSERKPTLVDDDLKKYSDNSHLLKVPKRVGCDKTV